jgi:hypothetical protein
MENACLFNDHSENFMANWYNLWPFGKVRGHLVQSSHFGMLNQEKSGNPGSSYLRGSAVVRHLKILCRV